ncbi:MAG: methyltransferase domain-containing protein [Defluviitaleaceae bacterium]|nr:methyltransferase domain-containing protein [Defluviitaleaceae bacterium]
MDVRDYYENQYDEKNRLFRDNANKVEYLTTVHFLDKFIPPNSRVLDACAGGGVYAFYLAEKGHQVTAGDFTPKHVEAMKANPKAHILADIRINNALDMGDFADDSFDAVLCFGALYHLMDADDRQKCVAECLRVTKAGGPAMFAYINRNGMYLDSITRGNGDIVSRVKLMKTGINEPFYGMDFGEADELFNGFDLDKIADIGVDGSRYPLATQLNNASDAEFAGFMDYHIATCQQPSIIGNSMHGLYIGIKK